MATGLALMGMAASSMGMFSAPAALPAQVGAPARAVPMTGPQRDPTSLAGVQNANVPADPNTAVATLIIPTLKVRAPIFERGLDPKGNMLIAHGYAVTQFQYSALIGAGNTVLYGHDDIEGSVFGRLQDLKPGDQIVIVLARSGESIVWRVTARTIVAPTAVEILNPTHDVRLTLFTCWPTWVDTKRVVITAVQA
ncbi:MAG TPA: sortase [Candidatus Limnocylindrales bacterium]|nr:sortase [Candidatus Limnocylindrales bacterium]